MRSLCFVCNAELSYQAGSAGSTGNILRHLTACLKAIHPDLEKALEAPTTVVDVLRGTVQMAATAPSDHAHAAVLRFIFAGNHPFSTVEQEAFKRLCATLRPAFKPYTRQTVAAKVLLHFF